MAQDGGLCRSVELQRAALERALGADLLERRPHVDLREAFLGAVPDMFALGRSRSRDGLLTDAAATIEVDIELGEFDFVGIESVDKLLHALCSRNRSVSAEHDLGHRRASRPFEGLRQGVVSAPTPDIAIVLRTSRCG